MTTKRKRLLKSEFRALFQTSSILFNFFLFLKSWRNCRGLNPKGPYLSLEKEKENYCAVFTNSIRRARESRRLATTAKKCTKKRLFCQYKPIVFLPFSLPSPSLLLKLSIVVILKCCYHGNVTSHFSSL